MGTICGRRRRFEDPAGLFACWLLATRLPFVATQNMPDREGSADTATPLNRHGRDLVSAENSAVTPVLASRAKAGLAFNEMVARGELSGQPLTLGAYLNLRLLVSNLRKMREQAKLSLADVAEKSGMDKAMLSRLENGHVANPGIETIARYMDALNKEIEWRVLDAPAYKIS